VTKHEQSPGEPTASDAAPSTDPAGTASHEELQAEIERLRTEADRCRDDMLRARAEVDNIRKRAARDVEAAHKFGLEKLVEALLPVKDSFDLGYDAALNTKDIKSLQDGMALTVQLFDTALAKVGVTPVDGVGSRFNPEHHQAVTMEISTTAEPGTVLRVFQKGYVLNDRLVRPAMVVVAKAAD
jgi:molecular chaperone GrpE